MVQEKVLYGGDDERHYDDVSGLLASSLEEEFDDILNPNGFNEKLINHDFLNALPMYA